MTDIEAIEIFNRKLNAAQAVLDSGFGEHPGESATMYHRNKALYKVAISALQERIERERNEPLTLDELRKMDGEPVYLEIADGVYGLVDWTDQEVTMSRGMSLSITTAVVQGCVYRHRPAMPGEEQHEYAV